MLRKYYICSKRQKLHEINEKITNYLITSADVIHNGIMMN